ncbi:hypothetical protein U0070_026377 [Myodes glareolus]|uniref:Uncharacterized protein n=1 Tax=Myodes glareolus TaxID=447135 RepID=A0AAW0IL82_MYOGA
MCKHHHCLQGAH